MPHFSQKLKTVIFHKQIHQKIAPFHPPFLFDKIINSAWSRWLSEKIKLLWNQQVMRAEAIKVIFGCMYIFSANRYFIPGVVHKWGLPTHRSLKPLCCNKNLLSLKCHTVPEYSKCWTSSINDPFTALLIFNRLIKHGNNLISILSIFDFIWSIWRFLL